MPPWLVPILRHPVATAGAVTLGVRVGQEVYRLRLGEISPEEFEKRAGQHIGALLGAIGGASLGWSLGRGLPGIGHLAGAFAGGLVGQVGGEHVGRAGAARFARSVRSGGPSARPPGRSQGPKPDPRDETETEDS